jgi:hypothetical protein
MIATNIVINKLSLKHHPTSIQGVKWTVHTKSKESLNCCVSRWSTCLTRYPPCPAVTVSTLPLLRLETSGQAIIGRDKWSSVNRVHTRASAADITLHTALSDLKCAFRLLSSTVVMLLAPPHQQAWGGGKRGVSLGTPPPPSLSPLSLSTSSSRGDSKRLISTALRKQVDCDQPRALGEWVVSCNFYGFLWKALYSFTRSRAFRCAALQSHSHISPLKSAASQLQSIGGGFKRKLNPFCPYAWQGEFVDTHNRDDYCLLFRGPGRGGQVIALKRIYTHK